ncbi:hypothetical protein OEZ86_001148 [Tetradesmus obliquus]|nr:hypothetical protein OEZ86_001148 [Tetradesmus obliquus]
MAQRNTSNSNSSGWHLASIQVKAFKSFSRPASFDISSSGLVGIVGPNGCGKSNLLEAVCFACGCSTAVLRGCRSFKDVTSTDAGSQLPEVKLELAHGSKRSCSHMLKASLTAERARVFKVDGRLKSGTQVKEFLRGLGIVVDTTTVIQQASITRLTDSNNPATLADLVAAASGLTSWNQETTAARQEVARTRRALKDIQANIAHVQAAVAADASALEAAAAAARLDVGLEQQLERLTAAMLQQQAALQGQVTAAAQQQQELQASSTAASEQLQQLTTHKQQLQQPGQPLQQ